MYERETDGLFEREMKKKDFEQDNQLRKKDNE